MFTIGDKVQTENNRIGTILYIGPVETHGDGTFYGIESENEIDNGNNGIHKGIHYFTCRNGCGFFISEKEKEKLIKIENNDNNLQEKPSSSGESSNNNNFQTISQTLERKMSRRLSIKDIESKGVVPNQYFENPIRVAKRSSLIREMIVYNLEEFFAHRPSSSDVEKSGIVPKQYFDDPFGATNSQTLVREIISSKLTEFIPCRPSRQSMIAKHILPQEYMKTDDPAEANNLQRLHKKFIEESLTHLLNPKRRPTLTDLGDMHIIP